MGGPSGSCYGEVFGLKPIMGHFWGMIWATDDGGATVFRLLIGKGLARPSGAERKWSL